jgi:hypothetical protein
LLGLYRCAENPASRVDDGLVDSFYYPAKREGSVEALNQMYTNDAGPTPMELHTSYPLLSQVPIHLIWGSEDQGTPLAGPVGQFYQFLANQESSNVSMEIENNSRQIENRSLASCVLVVVSYRTQLGYNQIAAPRPLPFISKSQSMNQREIPISV